MGNIRHNL